MFFRFGCGVRHCSRILNGRSVKVQSKAAEQLIRSRNGVCAEAFIIIECEQADGGFENVGNGGFYRIFAWRKNA